MTQDNSSTGERLTGAPNLQALWCRLLMEELSRHGVTYVVYGPGSRSSPLLLAALHHPGLQVKSWIDERGAAFHALGHARATGIPAVVLTTSGTAAANLLPAVVEASLDFVPLIALTADRPPELHDCGANQSIEQTSLLSSHARAVIKVPCATEDISLRFVLSQAARAASIAAAPRPGPVHINVALREPLDEQAIAWDHALLDDVALYSDERSSPWNSISSDVATPPGDALHEWAETLSSTPHGLIVAADYVDPEEALALAKVLGWPLIADIRSGIRLGHPHPNHAPHLERFLGDDQHAGAYVPDVVVQLGGRVTSKRLLAYLGKQRAKFLIVSPYGDRLGVAHSHYDTIHADPTTWCDVTRAILEMMEMDERTLPQDIAAHNQRVEDALDAAMPGSLSEPWVARHITQTAPQSHGFFVSNSMPIRDVQSFGAVDGHKLSSFTQRGASGIDGILSTASGCAEGLGQCTTLLVGDLTFLHDLSALPMLRSCSTPLIIVVLNNRGGSIFSFLPIGSSASFSPHFDTPHDLDLTSVASAFGLTAHQALTRDEFASHYEAALSAKGHTVIEVISGQRENYATHQAIEQAIAEALA